MRFASLFEMSASQECYLRASRSLQKLSRIIFNRRTPANEIRGARVARGRPIILFIRAYVRLCDTKDCGICIVYVHILVVRRKQRPPSVQMRITLIKLEWR